MTAQITADAVPTVIGKRFGGHMLRIECPFCRTRKGKGKPIMHVHGKAARRKSACRGRGMDIDSPIATLMICRRSCGSGAATTRWAITSSRPARRARSTHRGLRRTTWSNSVPAPASSLMTTR